MPAENSRKGDLNVAPTLNPSPGKHLCIGDLHGNALKLIYIAIEEGILKLKNPKSYETLRDIYLKDPKYLNINDILYFKQIIEDATVDNSRSVTLIGDEVADRGKNDYFTLLLLKKLKKSNLNLDITLSNHSLEFIRDYFLRFTGKNSLGPGQAYSLQALAYLKSRLIHPELLMELTLNEYLPLIKAFSYTISSEGNMTIFSHAPVGLETIYSLAKSYGIKYDDSSVENLAATIDAINEKLQASLLDRSIPSEFIKKLDEEKRTNSPTTPIPVSQPLNRLTWNRVVGDELCTKPSGSFEIQFVHGHIGQTEKNVSPSHINTDNNFGKFSDLFKTGDIVINGETIPVKHSVFSSNEMTKMKQEEINLETGFLYKKSQNILESLRKEILIGLISKPNLTQDEIELIMESFLADPRAFFSQSVNQDNDPKINALYDIYLQISEINSRLIADKSTSLPSALLPVSSYPRELHLVLEQALKASDLTPVDELPAASKQRFFHTPARTKILNELHALKNAVDEVMSQKPGFSTLTK